MVRYAGAEPVRTKRCLTTPINLFCVTTASAIRHSPPVTDGDKSGSSRVSITLLFGAVVASAPVAWLGLHVPYDGYDSGWLWLLGILGVLALLILLGAAMVRSLRATAATILVLSVAAVSIAFGGEAIRWSWSEAELTALAQEPSRWGGCASTAPCRVSWWKVGDVESLGSAVYLQSPVAANGCGMGGLLLADASASQTTLEEDLREMFPSFSASVKPYRGIWLTACLYS